MLDGNPLDVIDLKIPAKAEYVGVIRLFMSGLANRIGFNYDAIEDVKVAVTEACTNVVTHACLEDNGKIHITCKIYDDRLVIAVADKGTRIDVEQMEEQHGPIDADLPAHSLREGGLGIYLMKSLMDGVDISHRDGVVVRMTKVLQKDEVERDHTTTENPHSSRG